MSDLPFAEAYYREQLSEQMCREFGCAPLAAGRDKHESRKRRKKREEITEITHKFCDVMQSDNPPKSEPEAVRAMFPAGIVGWILIRICSELVIKLISALWRRHNQ